MKTSRIDKRGHVTGPKDLRDGLGWNSGDEVTFVRVGDSLQVSRLETRPTGEDIVKRFERVKVALNGNFTTEERMAFTRGED